MRMPSRRTATVDWFNPPNGLSETPLRNIRFRPAPPPAKVMPFRLSATAPVELSASDCPISSGCMTAIDRGALAHSSCCFVAVTRISTGSRFSAGRSGAFACLAEAGGGAGIARGTIRHAPALTCRASTRLSASIRCSACAGVNRPRTARVRTAGSPPAVPIEIWIWRESSLSASGKGSEGILITWAASDAGRASTRCGIDPIPPISTAKVQAHDPGQIGNRFFTITDNQGS